MKRPFPIGVEETYSAVMVLTGDGSEPPPLNDLISRPGLSAAFEIEKGGLDDFMASPLLGVYLSNQVPVIAAFCDEADAVEFRRRTGLLHDGGRA